MFKPALYPNVLLIPAPPHAHTLGPAVIPGNIGRRVLRKVISAPTYQILPSDEYLAGVVNATLTLPPAQSVPSGWMVLVGNAAPASLTVVVAPSGTDTIGSVIGSLSIGSTVGLGMFVSDGVDNWESISPATPILL